MTTARRLDEFSSALAEVPRATLTHHAAHGDFSRWLREVFRDDLLADRLAKLERRWCRGDVADFGTAAAQLIANAMDGRLHAEDPVLA